MSRIVYKNRNFVTGDTCNTDKKHIPAHYLTTLRIYLIIHLIVISLILNKPEKEQNHTTTDPVSSGEYHLF